MKKKILSAVMALAVVTMALAGCSSSSSDAKTDDKTEETTDTATENRGTVNVGFVQLVDMADATAMYDGFTRTIEEAGLSDNIKIDYQDAAGDTGTMTTMIQSFVDNNYDLIVPMLTPPTQAAVNIAGGDIPIIFMSVVDPVYSKIVPDWDSVDPNYLATGTSNTIPADLIIDTAMDITPIADGQKICIMYNTSQNNAQCTMEAAAKYCDSIGVEYDVVGYADVTDAVTQAQAFSKGQYAFVYVALDSIIAANFNQLGAALTELGIPSYGAADAMTMGGAFCSYGIDYDTVGVMTANMVIDWYNGKEIIDMPCQRYSDFTLVINKGVQESLGIELPAEYADIATYVGE